VVEPREWRGGPPVPTPGNPHQRGDQQPADDGGVEQESGHLVVGDDASLLALESGEAPRLAYALPILAGTLVALWQR